MAKRIPLEDRLLWKIPISAMRMIMAVTTILIVLTIFLSVCMRYVLKSDLFAIEEIITVVAMWLFFISGGYGSYEGSHIRADLFSIYIKSERKKRVIKIINQTLSILILGVFVYWALQFADWSIRANAHTAGWKIPLIWSQIAIPIGFVLMLIFTIYNFVNLLRGLPKEERN